MTNFERIMQCKTPEELAYIYMRLKEYAIYANGRLLDSSANDFVEWLNKTTDTIDKNIAFSFDAMACIKCGHMPILTNEWGEIFYKCPKCGFRNKSENNHGEKLESRSELEARIIWNY